MKLAKARFMANYLNKALERRGIRVIMSNEGYATVEPRDIIKCDEAYIKWSKKMLQQLQREVQIAERKIHA